MATQKSTSSTLTNDQKREWAQMLYTKERMSQKEIAQQVGTSEKTVSTWKEKFGWDAMRKSLLVTKEETLRRLYNQIDALTQEIEDREEKPYPDSKESDILNKITASIKALETETSIAEIFDVGKKFIEFLKAQDLTKAQEVLGYFDAFMQAALGGKINSISPIDPRHRQ